MPSPRHRAVIAVAATGAVTLTAACVAKNPMTIVASLVTSAATMAVLDSYYRKGGLIRRSIFRRLGSLAWSLGASRPVLRTGLPAGIAGQAMRLAARLMPSAAGRRWLAEADSFLFEAPSGRRAAVIGDYLATAPWVIAVAWVGELARAVRRRPAAEGQGGNHDCG